MPDEDSSPKFEFMEHKLIEGKEQEQFLNNVFSYRMTEPQCFYSRSRGVKVGYICPCSSFSTFYPMFLEFMLGYIALHFSNCHSYLTHKRYLIKQVCPHNPKSPRQDANMSAKLLPKELAVCRQPNTS